MFLLYIKQYLCLADYNSKFPVIKRRDSLILMCKVIIGEYGLSKKIMSETDDNFVSERFKEAHRNLSMKQELLHHITTKAMSKLKCALNSLNTYERNPLILMQVKI